MKIELVEQPLCGGNAIWDNAQPNEVVIIALSSNVEDGGILTAEAIHHDDLGDTSHAGKNKGRRDESVTSSSGRVSSMEPSRR